MKTILKHLLALATLLSACQQPLSVKQNQHGDLFTTENLPFTRFEISGNADTMVTGINGTKIFIPQSTFIDAYGKPCLGSLTLELKEALNPLDMVLGNMTTLSNGNILQSGGMIYVNARQGNQSLAIDKGKAISVSVPAASRMDSMNIYSSTFDSASRQFNWIRPEDRMIRFASFSGSDSIPAPVLKQPSLNAFLKDPVEIFDDNNSASVLPPAKPSQPAENDTILSLIFDTAAFPELSQYRNVKFKKAEGGNTSFGDSKQVWHEMQLEKTETEGLYLITFTRYTASGTLVRKYKVSPVLSGTDYETAMKEYNGKFELYEQKKREIEAKRVEAERQQRLNMEMAEAEMKKQQEAEIKRQQEAARNSGINSFREDASINYVFTLDKLGWANIDRLYHLPASQRVDLQTRVRSEESYESIYISLMFDKEKIYLPGYQKQDHSFGFTHNDNEKTVLPIGASAVVIVTAYKNGELHFASRRITIAKQMDILLDPLPFKKEELKETLSKII